MQLSITTRPFQFALLTLILFTIVFLIPVEWNFTLISDSTFNLSHIISKYYYWTYTSGDFYKRKKIVGNLHQTKLLINTPGCVLPRTAFYPGKFSMKKYQGFNCSFEKRIVTIDETNGILKLTEDGSQHMGKNKNSCTVIEIQRYPSIDSFKLSKTAIPITTTLNISDKELFRTKCGKYVNFDAHFPIKTHVRDKLNYWEKQRQQEKRTQPLPMSVLLIGFDSISRSNFHRSLKQTLPIMMKQMGFIDFKGYHSMAPSTLSNFFAFLMGLSRSQVSKCSKWLTPYDKCPLIWEQYDLNNYVTMYTEDGSGTFNWGGQSGFVKRPTDYYSHPLFASLAHYTPIRRRLKDHFCPSTMNSSDWLLDYVKRFIQKFMKIPFFSFVWFEDPFHDNVYTLYGFDKKLAAFYQFLNSDEAQELRERTLLILISDHGDRFGDFMRRGYREAIYERALPGLFIRLPDNLLKQYPDLDLNETLRENSKKLTNGFDVHHTLLHLLKLQGLDIFERGLKESRNTSGVNFEPVLKNRTSLFSQVSDQRTCQDINILEGTCVCSRKPRALTRNLPLKGRRFLNVLVRFAISQLNSLIRKSKYKEMCRTHKKTRNSLMSWNVIKETKLFTIGSLQFLTNLHKARFEVQLRINNKRGVRPSKATDTILQINDIQRINSFNRLSRYGDLSWCVKVETEQDKLLKELCHCKKKKKKKKKSMLKRIV